TAFNDVISLTITGFYCSYFMPAAFLLYHRVKGHVSPHTQETPGLQVGDDTGIDSSHSDPIGNSPDAGLYDDKKATRSGIDPPHTTANTTGTNDYPSFTGGRRQSLVAQASLQW